MARKFDMELMMKLTSTHPVLGARIEMMRKWRTGQSMPSLRTLIEVLNHSNVNPNKLFPEVPHDTSN